MIAHIYATRTRYFTTIKFTYKNIKKMSQTQCSTNIGIARMFYIQCDQNVKLFMQINARSVDNGMYVVSFKAP